MLVRLRCYYCGQRTEVVLDQVDLRKLHEQGFLPRICLACRDTTRWEAALESPDRPPVESAATAARILLIDDDDDILAVLGKALDHEGYDVERLASARDALTRLARADFELVLSDIRMPGFDGRQLFAFLEKQLPEYKGRVVFLTGDVGNAETMRFLQDVGAPYLVKPIAIDELLSLVKTCLQKTHAIGS